MKKDETKKEPAIPQRTDKAIPLSEQRTNNARRFNLKKIVIGFVFALAFVSGAGGYAITVPLSALAIWMQMSPSS